MRGYLQDFPFEGYGGNSGNTEEQQHDGQFFTERISRLADTNPQIDSRGQKP
jgi:hypothetical protein